MEQIKEYEYIDLGLPSGLKWATMNVGATSEADYGSYFQWGDIEDKSNSDCSWENYKYCKGTYNTLTKYCVDNNEYGPFGTVDNKITLDLEDDAARAHMGNDWRMPTRDEFRELFDYTNNEWISNYKGTGVNGRKFTSKTNGNSIFIPAAGYCNDGSVYNIGYGGYVWSSSLRTSNPYDAWYLYFYSSNCSMSNSNRCNGRSVRGVRN